MTTDWLEVKLWAEMQAVLNRSAWYLTLSNVCVTSSDSIVVMSSTHNGNVCDYDDDMRNEVKIKQAWVYDYLDLHKENLRASLNYRRPYEKTIPYVNFVKTGSTKSGATQNESWLPTVSKDSGEPKRRKKI